MASGLAEAGPVAFARPVPLRTSGLQARKLRPIFAGCGHNSARFPPLSPTFRRALFACAERCVSKAVKGGIARESRCAARGPAERMMACANLGRWPYSSPGRQSPTRWRGLGDKGYRASGDTVPCYGSLARGCMKFWLVARGDGVWDE
jgi:hypothetical protein